MEYEGSGDVLQEDAYPSQCCLSSVSASAPIGRTNETFHFDDMKIHFLEMISGRYPRSNLVY